MKKTEPKISTSKNKMREKRFRQTQTINSIDFFSSLSKVKRSKWKRFSINRHQHHHDDKIK